MSQNVGFLSVRAGSRWMLSECGASIPLHTTKAKLKKYTVRAAYVSPGPQAVLENRPFVPQVDWTSGWRKIKKKKTKNIKTL